MSITEERESKCVILEGVCVILEGVCVCVCSSHKEGGREEEREEGRKEGVCVHPI